MPFSEEDIQNSENFNKYIEMQRRVLLLTEVPVIKIRL